MIGANKGGGQKFRNIMQADALPGSVGYVSMFVEMFAWVLDMESYELLWDLLCPGINPYGWGHDLWFYNYGLSRRPGFRMGIISSVEVKHEQNLAVAGGGRTESATDEMRWNGVKRQEAAYSAISLRKCKFSLPNQTLHGAVIDLIYEEPPPPQPGGLYPPDVRDKRHAQCGKVSGGQFQKPERC